MKTKIPMLLAGGALLALLAGTQTGCAARVSYATTARPASLVSVGPGVWTVYDYHQPVFYSNGYYWLWSGGTWHQSRYVDYGFRRVHVSRVPMGVRRIDRPSRYVRYRGGGSVRAVPSNHVRRTYRPAPNRRAPATRRPPPSRGRGTRAAPPPGRGTRSAPPSRGRGTRAAPPPGRGTRSAPPSRGRGTRAAPPPGRDTRSAPPSRGRGTRSAPPSRGRSYSGSSRGRGTRSAPPSRGRSGSTSRGRRR